MKDDHATTLIWALGAVVAVTIFAVALIMVRNAEDDGSVSEIELLNEFFDSGFTPDELDQLPSDEGITEFASFEEAEAQAGYHILRPSAEFVLRDGVTRLHSYSRQAQELTPLSSSEYESSDTSLIFSIIPSEIGIVDVRGLGDDETIGSKDGSLFKESGALHFAWTCDVGATVDTYCAVVGFPEVERATFERFVESLQ